MYVKFDKGAKYSSVRNIDDQEISEYLDGFDDAGYILTKNDLVVDIDDLDKSTIEALIKTFNIDTQVVWTDRGAHLYFMKPAGFNRSRGMTPFGFKVEYKTANNTKAVTIKRHGEKRKVDNEGIRQYLPECLMPGKYKQFLGMSEGDGRNDYLHAHKFKIAKVDEHEKILRFINKYIFEEPLSEDEFLNVVRHEQLEITGKDDEYQAATALIEEIDPVVYNERIYFYRDNHYIHDDNILRRIVAQMFPGFKTRYIDEVIKQVQYRAPLSPKNPVFDIKLKNGYLHKGKFIEGDYTDFTPYYIDLKYDPDTEPVPIVDDYLDNLSDHDPEYKRFILEIFGHCLITDPRVIKSISKFFFFIGSGGEGKGTFLDIVEKIIGDDNCSRVDINDLSDERYFTSIDLKLANLGDDQQNTAISGKQMKKLKNLSTADTVSMRSLYENPRIARPIATLIFTTNYELKSFDKDESYKRRVVWCPMFHPPEKKSHSFFEQVTTPECLQYWIKLVVEGYMRIYERGHGMDIPEKVVNFTKRYHEDNDNMPLFVSSLSDSEIEGQRSPVLHQQYETWAEDNGFSVLSLKHMIKTIRELRGYDIKVKRLDGTPTRVFAKIENEDKDKK